MIRTKTKTRTKAPAPTPTPTPTPAATFDEGTVWNRYQFPTLDVNTSALHAHGSRWFAAKYSLLRKPYCWTPIKAFWFGGKKFVPLYPCIAGATKDHGFIVQQGPQGLLWGKE